MRLLQDDKGILQGKNVTYEEKDVSTDATARDEMISKSNQMGVPVIDVDGQLTVGFNKERLTQLLNIK